MRAKIRDAAAAPTPPTRGEGGGSSVRASGFIPAFRELRGQDLPAGCARRDAPPAPRVPAGNSLPPSPSLQRGERKTNPKQTKKQPQTPRSPPNPINSFACSRLNSFQPPPAAPGGVPPTSTSCFLFFSGFFPPSPFLFSPFSLPFPHFLLSSSPFFF